MRNSVNKIDMSLVLKDKEKYASEFSEGNDKLKECLLLLWNNNIKTVGCCAGHIDSKEKMKSSHDDCYIGMVLDDNIKLLNFFSKIDKNNIDITFVSNNNVQKVVSVHCLNKNYFNKILSAIKDSDNSNDRIIEFLFKFFNKKIDNYLNIGLRYRNKNLKLIYLNTNNLKIINYLKDKCRIIWQKYDMYSFEINENDIIELDKIL